MPSTSAKGVILASSVLVFSSLAYALCMHCGGLAYALCMHCGGLAYALCIVVV